MNEEELKRLVGKYYNGESTEEEESALRKFFKSGNIPAGYEAEKEIFSYYTDSEEIPEPSHDFEVRIMAAIDAKERKNGIRKLLLPILSAAAGLLILGGSYFFFISRTETSDTFSDPDIAYAETMKILREVSMKLNKGTNVLEPVGKLNEMTRKSFKTINESTTTVEKNMKDLDWLQRAIDAPALPE
jgi:hypothetical protein